MFKILSTFGIVSVALLLAGCATAPQTETKRENLITNAESTLKQMTTEDSGLQSFLDRSYAYAIFPEVGKGGLIAGGAYGHGVVYQGGNMVGYADISQATVGLQAGGQTFSELVVFETQEAFNRFTSGKLAFAANASAVALKSGAAATAKYSDGVAIFVKPRGGLMAEAAIGGQQFTYQAK